MPGITHTSPVPWHENFPRRQQWLASIVIEAWNPTREKPHGDKYRKGELQTVCLCSGDLNEDK
jgi:hypothetical protein